MKALFLAIFMVIAANSFSQSLTDLRARKINMEQVIKYTSLLIRQAYADERSSMSRLQLINNQIENRKIFIQNMNQEIDFLSYWINENDQALNLLQSDLSAMKKEYAGMIRFAQKNEDYHQMFVYLLSADSFNQAYRRFLYLRQYAGYRKVQAKAIESISGEISTQLIKLQKRKKEKEQLVQEKVSETIELKNEIQRQQESIVQLQQQQQDLKRQQAQQQDEQQKLNQEIEDLIARDNAENQKKKEQLLNDEQKKLSQEFLTEKGKLPWPVEQGVIISHFGVHPHPVLKQLEIRNNGIDISTISGAKVHVVFTGEVSRIFSLSGENKAIIIRHGSFLTVYSNLSEILVKPGQKVKSGDVIGHVSSTRVNMTQNVLKFQLWKENQKMDPEKWLLPKLLKSVNSK